MSFSVRAGEIFGILGRNGAGKTTTVECLSGLGCPTAAISSVLGLNPQEDRDELHERVGVQLQQSALPPKIRVGEAVELSPPSISGPPMPTISCGRSGSTRNGARTSVTSPAVRSSACPSSSPSSDSPRSRSWTS